MPPPEMLFYDGHCGLCHNAVLFLLRADPEGRLFRFAPLDSQAFRTTVPAHIRASLPDSVVVWTSSQQALAESSAVLHIGRRLGGIYGMLAAAASLVPRFVRDRVYRFVARVRYRIFARPTEVCPVIPRELRSRFDL